MDFYWSLSVNKSLQVSRTLLSILADLNNAVIWTVSTSPIISKSSRPYPNHLVTVPREPITIGIIVSFTLHSVFQFLRKVQVLIPLFVFFHIYTVVRWDSKVSISASVRFFCWLLLGLVVWPRLSDPFVSQNLRCGCVSFSRRDYGLFINYLFLWWNFTFLLNPKGISLLTQSCQVLYSLRANFPR